MGISSPDLTTHIAGMTLQNPVMTASGTFGYGGEFRELVDLRRLGAIIVKGLSLQPAAGNPPPRIVETPCGMLNAIGLENIGITEFRATRLKFLRKLGVPIIVNIYGQDQADYVALAEIVDDEPDIAAIEVNISCPNVKAGGIAFGVDPAAAAALTRQIRAVTTKPLILKLSPNVTDIVAIARAVEAEGADAVSLINTITGMAIDVNTRRPKLANITGGLSGPAIRPVAVRMVWQVAQVVSIPVIGIGGIMNGCDALEFMIAGASAVQVGTANFVNPGSTVAIIDGICREFNSSWLAEAATDIPPYEIVDGYVGRGYALSQPEELIAIRDLVRLEGVVLDPVYTGKAAAGSTLSDAQIDEAMTILADAVRATDAADDTYTFWDYQAGAWQKNNGIRIDHILLSPRAADRLEHAAIDKHTRGWEKPSDHVPVIARFEVS